MGYTYGGLSLANTGDIITQATVSTNFENVLKHQSGTTAPTNPVTGQVWYDTTVGVTSLKVWNGAAWVPVGGAVAINNAAPTSPITGALWYNDTSGLLQIWNGTDWKLVNDWIAISDAPPTSPFNGQLWYDSAVNYRAFVWSSVALAWIDLSPAGAPAPTSATTAETIAGTVDDKYVSPADLKAALQSGVVYPVSVTQNGTKTVIYPAGSILGSSDARLASASINTDSSATNKIGVWGEVITANGGDNKGVFGFITGGTPTGDQVAGVAGQVGTSVVTGAGVTTSGVFGLQSSAGAGIKIGTYGVSQGTGTGDRIGSRAQAFGDGAINYGVYATAVGASTTNIGVYGEAQGVGSTNWAGYFDGSVRSTILRVTGVVNDETAVFTSPTTNSATVIGTNRTGSDGNAVLFQRNGLGVGSIFVNGSGVSYNTSSDYRLKTNYQPLTGSGAFIDALKPYRGEWKSQPGKSATYFIAHEVAEVSPSTVNGIKDAVEDIGTLTNANGSTRENIPEPSELQDGQTWIKTGERPVMQSMEYGSADFITNIIAELQDLRKRVAELESAQQQ